MRLASPTPQMYLNGKGGNALSSQNRPMNFSGTTKIELQKNRIEKRTTSDLKEPEILDTAA